MIAEVDIPFLEEFKDDMLRDQKVCTSRTQLYGTNGDTFKTFGAEFRIVCSVRLPLSVIAECLYGQEGFLNPQGFKDTWVKLHPRKGYIPDWIVYVHFFTRIR